MKYYYVATRACSVLVQARNISTARRHGTARLRNAIHAEPKICELRVATRDEVADYLDDLIFEARNR